MQLRPYQNECVESVLTGWREFRKLLVVVPTGGGKTIIFSALANRLQPERVLILAHREELIDQAIIKLYKSTGLMADKEKAEHKASLSAQVVVASIQTMARRLGKWPQDHFGVIIVDEAHHCLASTFQRVLGHFTDAKVLGVTATPDRGDKKNLGKYFEHVAYEIGLFELIHQGYLAKISVQSLPVEIDLAKVRTTTGDYNESDLGDALAPWLGAIARQIAKHASFRRTLIFLPLCATSRTMVEHLNATGLSACHVDGNSPDRAEILRDFASGRYDVLCNAMLLTEGFDDPGIDCVCVLRPTKSRALFCQMVGRGTRPAPCKTDLLLLDFLWQHTQHNLIRPAHLIAASNEQAEEMQRMIDAEAVEEMKGGEYGKQQILDLEGVASEAQVAREKKLKEELAAKAKRAAKTIDAMEFCLQLHVPDVAEFEPMNAYESAPVSEGQKKRLADNGIDPDTVQNRGQASKIIDTIIQRARLNLATPKQVKWLTKFGVPSPHTISFDAASAYLTQRFGGGKKPQATQQPQPF